jgi:hypothetical protein
LLVFTTQGESCLAHLGAYGPEFAAAEARYREGLQNEGACFVPYARNTGYGITILAERYVARLVEHTLGPALVRVHLRERGWDGHQDVWAYRRVGPADGADAPAIDTA